MKVAIQACEKVIVRRWEIVKAVTIPAGVKTAAGHLEKREMIVAIPAYEKAATRRWVTVKAVTIPAGMTTTILTFS